jgi:YegS/Rv2252/BmrU family lipid kinase
MSRRRLSIVCNPTAGGGRTAAALDAVVARLTRAGVEVGVQRSESAAHASELVRTAAQDGSDVVAFGGDGMVRLAAHAIRGSGATLGILPGGRGNDFARKLGIPLDPVAACEVLIDGSVRDVDAGEADGETFVGIASIGIESEVTRIANKAPRFLGESVYQLSTFAGLLLWRAATFELVLDTGEQRSFRGYMAAASNSGRFGGGMQLAPDARLDDGLLDVVMIEHGPKWRFAKDSGKLFEGTHVHDRRVHIVKAREVRLSADRPFEVYADGDQIAQTPAVVRAVPAALRVLAP